MEYALKSEVKKEAMAQLQEGQEAPRTLPKTNMVQDIT